MAEVLHRVILSTSEIADIMDNSYDFTFFTDEELSNEQIKSIVAEVCKRAASKVGAASHFYDWFMSSTYFDDMWNAIRAGFDEYIYNQLEDIFTNGMESEA